MTGLASLLSLAAVWTAGGLLLGTAYFATLRRTVDLLLADGGRLTWAALTLGRLVAMTLFLAGAARFGALPLLGAFLGFLVARGFALRRSRRVA
jgi:F1-F0 ATPase (N-ATPase) AtpR subunit